MAAPLPDYNVDDAQTLLAPGRLKGKAVQVDPKSVHPVGDGRLFQATLNGAAAFPHLRGGEFGKVAIKVTEDDRTRRPREPRREALTLADLDHPNIISLLNAYVSEPTSSAPAPRVMFFTPSYPRTLRDLLDSPAFTSEEIRTTPCFSDVARSLAFQLSSAVAYLHERGIAHRDINPSNVVVSAGGRAVLIDFGIAVPFKHEKPGEMHFEVGTGSYRAPELVFASRDYDPAALDLWALGCTIAELYRPLAYPPPPSPPSSTEDDFERYYRECATPEPPPRLRRQPLFDASLSDFVLAASIFRVLGTPTIETWPEAAQLPNFSRFTFSPFPPTPLPSHLPHLDPSEPVGAVLASLLRISASSRIKADEVVAALGEAASGIWLPDDLDPGERDRLGPLMRTVRDAEMGGSLRRAVEDIF